MKLLFIAVVLLFSTVGLHAQFELAPSGFNTVALERPNLSDEALMEAVRSWMVNEYQHNEYGYDVYDEQPNGLTWSAQMPHAFFYRNRGEEHFHRIKYECNLRFDNRQIQLDFRVVEIYTARQVTQLTTGAFFNQQGILKDDYRDAKPSLERNVNRLLRSFTAFMGRYN